MYFFSYCRCWNYMWKFIQSYVFNFLSMLPCRSFLWSHQTQKSYGTDWRLTLLKLNFWPLKRSLYNMYIHPIPYVHQVIYRCIGTDESDRSFLTAWKGQLCEALVTSVIWLYCNMALTIPAVLFLPFDGIIHSFRISFFLFFFFAYMWMDGWTLNCIELNKVSSHCLLDAESMPNPMIY